MPYSSRTELCGWIIVQRFCDEPRGLRDVPPPVEIEASDPALPADGVAVLGSELPKNDTRDDGERPERYERVVDAAETLDLVGADLAGEEKGRRQSRRGDAEAQRQLLGGACDRAGVARLLPRDVGIVEGVHARVLLGLEYPVADRDQDDEPNRCASGDRSERHDDQAEDHRV